MKFNIKHREKNTFLNPEFVKEKTLRLEFEATKYTRHIEIDIPEFICHSIPYVLAAASAVAYVNDEKAYALGCAILPVLDVLTRSAHKHGDNNDNSDQNKSAPDDNPTP